MKKFFKKLLGPAITAIITRWAVTIQLKKIIKEKNKKPGSWSPTATMNYLFSRRAQYITPWQHREELEPLANDIAALKPQTILEIGTADGGTLFMAARLAAEDALIISIDLPEGMFGGGYEKWKIPLYKAFAGNRQHIELIRNDSHLPEVFNRVKEILGERTIDFMFLDGDHSYEGVKNDFNTFRKLLSKKSIVAFHDIVRDKSDNPDHFVSIFWNEIKGDYSYKEYIKDPDQDKLGLGVIFSSLNP